MVITLILIVTLFVSFCLLYRDNTWLFHFSWREELFLFWKRKENSHPVQKDLAVSPLTGIWETTEKHWGIWLEANICLKWFWVSAFLNIHTTLVNLLRAGLWEVASFWHLVEGDLWIPGCPSVIPLDLRQKVKNYYMLISLLLSFLL